MSDVSSDFYEDDEPVDKVRADYAQGGPGVTGRALQELSDALRGVRGPGGHSGCVEPGRQRARQALMASPVEPSCCW